MNKKTFLNFEINVFTTLIVKFLKYPAAPTIRILT